MLSHCSSVSSSNFTEENLAALLTRMSTLPIAAATFITWIVLLIAHARGVKFAGGRVSDYPLYSRISSVALLALAALISFLDVQRLASGTFPGSH